MQIVVDVQTSHPGSEVLHKLHTIFTLSYKYPFGQLSPQEYIIGFKNLSLEHFLHVKLLSHCKQLLNVSVHFKHSRIVGYFHSSSWHINSKHSEFSIK